MKEIIISEKNRERIEAELEEVQKRCTVRTITFSDIVSACEALEKKYPVAKKYLEGVSYFELDVNEQNFPSAYKYTPESTYINVVMRGGKWRLVKVYRYKTAREGHGITAIGMSDKLKRLIINSFLNMGF